MFPCAPFSDIQALGHEFPNLCFSAIVNDLHLYFVFCHIANQLNVILSILNEVIIIPEKGDLFRIGKTNMNTLRPKYDFSLHRISIWRQKLGSLCWKAGLHILPSYGNSSKKLVVSIHICFGNINYSLYSGKISTYWNIDRMSFNLLPISPKKTKEMQVICSGVDGIKVQLWQAITRYRTRISENGLRGRIEIGCSCQNRFVSKRWHPSFKGRRVPLRILSKFAQTYSLTSRAFWLKKPCCARMSKGSKPPRKISFRLLLPQKKIQIGKWGIKR